MGNHLVCHSNQMVLFSFQEVLQISYELQHQYEPDTSNI